MKGFLLRMKTYPSIPRDFMNFTAYVFDKIDGSNLRFELSQKKGAWKFGTRKCLFDESHPEFGGAIQLFKDTFEDEILDFMKANRIEKATAFAEYWGDNSFAGQHDDTDIKRLTLFDICIHKKGFLSPRAFLERFQHLDTPRFLGVWNWTRDFVDQVWEGELEGVTFEGVVGKHVRKGNHIVMRKAKTKAWIDRVKNTFSEDEASRIVES